MRDAGQPELLIRSLWPFAIKDSHLSAFAIVAAMALAVFWPVNLVGSVDSVIFNYLNNAAEAHALVYVSHWVSLYPTSIGYLVRDLPLVVQGAVYFLVPVCVAVVLQQELQKILEFAYRRLDAVILSFIVLVSIRLLCVLNLSWSVWPAYLAAACYILRKNIAAENYSIVGFVALGLACLSNPAAITFIPVLLLYAVRRRGAAAWVHAALIVAMTGFYILMFLHQPEGPQYIHLDIGEAGTQFFGNFFGRHRNANMAAMVAAACLIYLAVAAYRRTPAAPDRRHVELIFGLAFVGLSSLALYFVTFRLFHAGGIPARHAMMAVACAELGLFIYLAAIPARLLRTRLVTAALLIDVACAAMALRQAKRAFETTAEKYSYFVAATEFRRTCKPGEALSSARSGHQLVILCERRTFDQPITLVPEARLRDGTLIDGSAAPRIFSLKPLL